MHATASAREACCLLMFCRVCCRCQVNAKEQELSTLKAEVQNLEETDARYAQGPASLSGCSPHDYALQALCDVMNRLCL